MKFSLEAGQLREVQVEVGQLCHLCEVLVKC